MTLSDSAILHCDNHVLAVDKPPGIPTQPDLCDLARLWVKNKYSKPGNVFLEPIHRIDKPVGGVVLFARTSKALSRLQEQMRNREMHKIYHAWVEGDLPSEAGTLQHLLVHGSFRAIVSPNGKEAFLDYEVVKKQRGRSQVRIVLHTGRYHQIRAQMAAVDCPIIGDSKYGSTQAWSEGIALRASELTFRHPVTGETLHVVSRRQLVA